MSEETVKRIEEKVRELISGGSEINSNMIKKLMTLLIREGRRPFEEALRINYRRERLQQSMVEIRNLVGYLRNELRLNSDRELAYALGIVYRSLKTIRKE
ncbi:hypothetical protein [Pseudothermotoga sp.]